MSIQPQIQIHRKTAARFAKQRVHDPLASLEADVRVVARSVFENVRDAARIEAAMRKCAGELRRLRTPEPFHPEWSRIAILVELLVCSAAESHDAATRDALARLLSFNAENRDLLFVEAQA